MMSVALPTGLEWLRCVGMTDRLLENAGLEFFSKNKILPHKALTPVQLTNGFRFVSGFNYTCDEMSQIH